VLGNRRDHLASRHGAQPSLKRAAIGAGQADQPVLAAELGPA
jgi:hypothetical protein